MPRCLAIRIQKASFATDLGTRRSSGLRMWVDGVPSMGRPQRPSGILVNTNLRCVPPRDTRTRLLTPSGADPSFAIRSASCSSVMGSAVRVVAGGGGSEPTGWRMTAPAHSRPISESIPKTSSARSPSSSAIAASGSSSGSKPAKKGRTTPLPNVSADTGRESERSGVPGANELRASGVYSRRRRRRFCSTVATRMPSSQTSNASATTSPPSEGSCALPGASGFPRSAEAARSPARSRGATGRGH